MYGKERELTLEEAKTSLEKCGLTASCVEVKKPNIRYKDCVDRQVVGSSPRPGTKVKINSLITVDYVTQPIIDESRKLFMIKERQKKRTDRENHQVYKTNTKSWTVVDHEL